MTIQSAYGHLEYTATSSPLIPIHALGIGPSVSVALVTGWIELFDCAMPTRDARHADFTRSNLQRRYPEKDMMVRLPLHQR